MTLEVLDRWFSSVLLPDDWSSLDPSCNGIQVQNDGAQIVKVAFAVDACQETIERAIQVGAGLLFVHHGLFWRDIEPITGRMYKRIKTLLGNNLALYASHLPLDAHPEIGNNSGLCARLNLENVEPFGLWRGKPIGYKGEFATPLSINIVLSRLFPDGIKPLHVLPFGPATIKTVGIVSGAADSDVHQAIDEKLDLFVTGEVGHEIYHPAMESRISVIGCGHYYSETVGPKLLAERLGKETGIETIFIDNPTGL